MPKIVLLGFQILPLDDSAINTIKRKAIMLHEIVVDACAR
jgi:hypothetical protein